MKAQINLRSTLSNTTALQRGSAALAALALMALISALLIYVVRPSVPVIPKARVAVPAQRGNNRLDFGTGSVYDGGHYVTSQPVKRVSPNALNFGTGSVYDGGHYVTSQLARHVSPNGLDFGAGSVYDGGHYGSTVPTGSTTVKP
jgi:hypothetical protein